MKIILIKDYFQSKTEEIIIAQRLTRFWANKIVDLLNDSESDKSDDWFFAVQDD